MFGVRFFFLEIHHRVISHPLFLSHESYLFMICTRSGLRCCGAAILNTVDKGTPPLVNYPRLAPSF